MSRKVVVFGTGSFAEIVHFYLSHDSEYEVVAFTANKSRVVENTLLNLPVVPFEELETLFPAEQYQMYVAVGYKKVNRVRADIYSQAKDKGYKLISYISSKCTHWGDAVVGDNCFIFEDNTIQPFVTIGNNVVIWSGNHIGHHVRIGDHVFITSHVVVSGHVRVGSYSFLGINATIRDDISIGEACVIGAGAILMRSTGDKEVYSQDQSLPHAVKSDRIRM